MKLPTRLEPLLDAEVMLEVDASSAVVVRTFWSNAACTNAVVAICVVFVPDAAVGAFGVPVKVGEALVA